MYIGTFIIFIQIRIQKKKNDGLHVGRHRDIGVTRVYVYV